jgi:hypothetical protein
VDVVVAKTNSRGVKGTSLLLVERGMKLASKPASG